MNIVSSRDNKVSYLCSRNTTSQHNEACNCTSPLLLRLGAVLTTCSHINHVFCQSKRQEDKEIKKYQRVVFNRNGRSRLWIAANPSAVYQGNGQCSRPGELKRLERGFLGASGPHGAPQAIWIGLWFLLCASFLLRAWRGGRHSFYISEACVDFKR